MRAGEPVEPMPNQNRYSVALLQKSDSLKGIILWNNFPIIFSEKKFAGYLPNYLSCRVLNPYVIPMREYQRRIPPPISVNEILGLPIYENEALNADKSSLNLASTAVQRVEAFDR